MALRGSTANPSLRRVWDASQLLNMGRTPMPRWPAVTGGTGVPPVSSQEIGMSEAADVAAVGHVVASLQRGYVPAEFEKTP
jgi:hypothetical protein